MQSSFNPEPEFYDHHLGPLNDSRCDELYPLSNNINGKWTIFSLNLLGDPTLRIYSGMVAPSIVNVTVPWDKFVLMTGNITEEWLSEWLEGLGPNNPGCWPDEWQIQVIDPSSKSPVVGAKVQLNMSGVLKEVITDSSGIARFNASSSLYGKIGISIFHPAYLPSKTKIHLMDRFFGALER
jgi:hypothetical protein